MVRSFKSDMNVAGVVEQLSIDCSPNYSIPQIDVMSNRPPCKGPLLVITRLHHSLVRHHAGRTCVKVLEQTDE